MGKTSKRDFGSVASTYIILPSAANASQSPCSAMPRAPASHTMDPLQARRPAASHMVHRTSSPFPPSRYLWICLHCKTRRRGTVTVTHWLGTHGPYSVCLWTSSHTTATAIRPSSSDVIEGSCLNKIFIRLEQSYGTDLQKSHSARVRAVRLGRGSACNS